VRLGVIAPRRSPVRARLAPLHFPAHGPFVRILRSLSEPVLPARDGVGQEPHIRSRGNILLHRKALLGLKKSPREREDLRDVYSNGARVGSVSAVGRLYHAPLGVIRYSRATTSHPGRRFECSSLLEEVAAKSSPQSDRSHQAHLGRHRRSPRVPRRTDVGAPSSGAPKNKCLCFGYRTSAPLSKSWIAPAASPAVTTESAPPSVLRSTRSSGASG
jgi:hypothetical protein